MVVEAIIIGIALAWGLNSIAPHPEIIWVMGAKLRSFVRPCTKADLS